MSRTIRDAAGREVGVGDTVGGTTSTPQCTITGRVTEISYGRVRVAVATVSTPGRAAPRVGSQLWIPALRVFLVHAASPQVQAVVARLGQVTSLRWSGQCEDLAAAAEFAGRDLIAAADGGDGWTLFLRGHKARHSPDVVPPGWFILRPPMKGRHRACDPTAFVTSYAPIAIAHTA